MMKVRFVDLFAGMGGIRLGFEEAFKELNIQTECVFTSEIKKEAIDALHHNFSHRNFNYDITKIDLNSLEDFDFVLAGFPCQAFSSAGNRDGFCDTRGTLFFEVEKILENKRPYGFLLENVEGLVKHDLKDKADEVGNTLKTILLSLESLGYKVSWKVLDSKNFGVPQSRKRIYIAGTLKQKINLNEFDAFKSKTFKDIQEQGLPVISNHFTKKLLEHHRPEELYGKAIKDKRGGANNIHSWKFGLKGEITKAQQSLVEKLFKERRKKHWAEKIGIEWMDGMPLTLEQIRTFFDLEGLECLLDDLVQKGYIKHEHPKNKVLKKLDNGSVVSRRERDPTKEKGYNIVSGKLSFKFSKILDINDVTPTLVATDMERLGVIDNCKIRKLSLREGLRLFGYPETYKLDIFEENSAKKRKAFGLLGNTVVVPVVNQIAKKLALAHILGNIKLKTNKLF